MPNSRVTSFECEYDLVSNSAMSDASISSSTAGAGSNIQNLLIDNLTYSYMFVPEHNYCVLDETYEEYPNTFSTSYISNTMSDVSGSFTTVPQISLTFSQPQSCHGITFSFVENYPLEIQVVLHLSGATATYIINPDSLKYVAEIEMYECLGIDISFTKAVPYRYVKLVSILLGQILIWGENDIYSGNLVLEKSPVGDLLSINTLNFQVVDKLDEYNLANDGGLHRYFQKRQVAYAYEYINDEKLFLGKYYLDNFSWDERLVSLNCVSAMGIFEDVPYNEGDIYGQNITEYSYQNAYIHASTGQVISSDADIMAYFLIKPNTQYTCTFTQIPLSGATVADNCVAALFSQVPEVNVYGTVIYSETNPSTALSYTHKFSFNSGNNIYFGIKLVNINRSTSKASRDTLKFIQNVFAGPLLEDVFNVAGVEEYTIDTETYNTPVYGTIKPGTCREALRQILFACNSTIDTTSDDGILVYKAYDTVTKVIHRNSKINTKLTKNDYVYGVKVEFANYILNTDSVDEIVKDEQYTTGTHTVTFNEAYDKIKVIANGTEIVPDVVKKYYITFTLPSDAAVTILGNRYEKYDLAAIATNDYIEAGETDTIQTYTSTLCDAETALNKAQLILKYLNSRLSLNVQTLATDISLDGRRLVDNPKAGYLNFVAWYTSRNLDLTGGFIDTSEMTALYDQEYQFYYTGNGDLYSGESIGLI